MPDLANSGTGYTIGEVLTLSGGTGTPARVAITDTGAGGSLIPEGLVILDPGVYSAFPANPVSVTGGSGSGAKLILTGTAIFTAGTGYFPGQVLAANVGTFYNPVRVLVTKVGLSGEVTEYQIVDGGGYFGSLPGSLTFAFDGFSGADLGDPDLVPSGTGFALLPSWGLRYSQRMNGRLSFGIATLGPVNGGVLGNNVVHAVQTGAGLLIREDTAPYAGRASWLCVTGNSVMNNLYSIKGATGYVPDDDYNVDSIFDNNIIYP
jgi:hypothetical protein